MSAPGDPAVALAQLVKSIAENMPAHMQLQRLQAKLTREKFLALIDAGFSREEALLLCQKVPS